MRWHNAWCISSVSTVPLISCTRIMALSSQIRHCSPFYTGYGQAHVSYTADRVTHYVQYSKNISHHRGINATPYSVHFGRTPPDISIDMSQCKYCREELPICHLSCIACVDAYETTVAQHFCGLSQYCRSALNTDRIRRDTWIALSKQGESMIESSRKRFRPLELGDNVRVPIPIVDRAPIGPLSLTGTVTDIYSNGGAFQIGTKHGTIQSAFTRSDITPCGTNQLLLPTDVPNNELSVRTAARLEVGGPSIISCNCKM